MEIDEDGLHNIARLFMYQFNFTVISLDEWLEKHGDDLTDDERNLGYAILELLT